MRLTPKGRVYVGAVMRYVRVPNMRQMYTLVALLFLGALASAAVGPTMLAVFSVLVGLVMGGLVMALVFRNLLQEGSEVDTRGAEAMRLARLRAELSEDKDA